MVLACSFLSVAALADPAPTPSQSGGFNVVVSADAEIERFTASAMRLPSRTLTGLWAQGLLGYQLYPRLLLGLDVELGRQWQQTGIAHSAGTNETGWGWLVGPGAAYRLSSNLAVQASVDIAGHYEFDHQADWIQSDHLTRPIAARMALQYAIPQARHWSVEVSMRYLDFKDFVVQSARYDHASTQWCFGVGLAFRPKD